MEPTAIRERATAALATLAIDARFVVLLACILSIVATLAVVVRNVLPRLIGLVVRDATTTARRVRETGRWSSPVGLLTTIASRASGRRARSIG